LKDELAQRNQDIFGLLFDFAIFTFSPKKNSFKTWFVGGIFRFQKWFDADVLDFQIEL
jgi:hypothetical protein